MSGTGDTTGDEDYGMRPLAGGFSGETFLATAAGERTVVRVYGGRGARRGPAAPEVDAAVLRLVRGLLPVPQVLEARRADPATGAPGMLVTSFLPGERLDLLLPTLDAAARATVGRQLGTLLARLAQMPMPRPGLFADTDLRIEPLPVGDLPAWVERHRHALDWPADELAALDGLADRAQDLLDGDRRTVLVHGDVNPKNLLVDPGTLGVTALLDWEFAHAAAPGGDLGNLLRFDRDPAFAEAVLDEYVVAVPDAGTRQEVLDVARATDLYALVDLAARRAEGPGNPVADRADTLLRAVVRTGDLHVAP